MTEARLPQQPSDNWVIEAYTQIQQSERSGLPIGERITTVLNEYPVVPPMEDDDESLPPLQAKFKQFSRELLSTAPDLETFQERVGFLFSPDLRTHYAHTARYGRTKDKIVGAPIHAARLGIVGLAVFCQQHPEHIDAATEYLADHLRPVNERTFLSGTLALVRTVGTQPENFQEQVAFGYFDDVSIDFTGRLAIECLLRMNYGNRDRKITQTTLHDVLHAPLGPEVMYQLRHFNQQLNSKLAAGKEGQALDTQGYFANRTGNLYRDAYSMLRRAAGYAAEVGSANARAILQGLPEPNRTVSTRDHAIALANALTGPINDAYFHNHIELPRINPQAATAQLQAFDRILYVLRKELPVHPHHKTNMQQQEILQLAGGIASGLLDLLHVRMAENAPLTVGDVVMMFPDADPETLQTIISGAMTRFERQRQRQFAIYQGYRDDARRRHNQQYYGRRRAGWGFIS